MATYRLPKRGLAALCDLVERHGLDGDYVPVPIQHIAAGEGWEILYRDDLPDAYGVAVVTPSSKLMVVRGTLTHSVKRYTIAHEMAHVLCGHPSNIHLCKAEVKASRLHARHEREADMLAACLLIPRAMMADEVSVQYAALRCQVPRSLVLLRRQVAEAYRP